MALSLPLSGPLLQAASSPCSLPVGRRGAAGPAWPVVTRRRSRRGGRSASLAARASLMEAVPKDYGYVLLTVAASAVLTQWQGIQVAIQRRKSGVKYPQMYEDAENSLFNCYQRAHQNTLESYPSFLALLLTSGIAYPATSTIFGVMWVIGRVFYSLGYYTGDPQKRLQGMWGQFGLYGLIVTSAVFGVRQVL